VILLLVDVEKLNEINGAYGRDGGDSLLVDITGAITGASAPRTRRRAWAATSREARSHGGNTVTVWASALDRA
jgi:hypothetical protein